MADLTLAQRFGTNVAFDATTKALTINLADLNSIIIGGIDYGLDTSAMSDANKDTYASRILWALLMRNQAVQPETNNDSTVGVYITNQAKRNTIRNNVSQIGFQLLATAYKNDPEGVNLDPDAIGS